MAGPSSGLAALRHPGLGSGPAIVVRRAALAGLSRQEI